MKNRFALTLVLLGGALALALPVEAGSIAVRLGRFSPRGGSQIWQDTAADFGVLASDFASLAGGVELDFELSEFFDVTLGIDGYSRTVGSNYVDYVRDDGTEITQDHRLSVAPITVGVRFNPAGKFHRVIPYVGGGAGLYPYEFREEGEFIDFQTQTLDVFPAVFRDRGLGTGVFAAAGVEVAVSRELTVFGELRRHWASAAHGEDYVDFGNFDLDARQVSAGFTVRF